MSRSMYLVTGVSALMALSIACGRQNATPVSPSSATPASGDEVSGSDGSTLKTTAPALVSPINDTVLQAPGSTATLTITAATGKFGTGTLAYDFELYDASNVKIRTEIIAGMSWTVQNLEFDKRYTWRVRATSDGAYGPWSAVGAFRTPDLRGYMRGNEMYDPLVNGVTIGEMHGPLTFIPGLGVRLESQLSYISYTLPQTLTEGEFSLITSGMPANTEGGKTKLFAMGQNYDDIVTNDRRMTIEKRGDPAGVVAWRFITHDDQVDTEGADRQYVDFQESKTYFWQATWRNNRFNLLIREGGVDGRTIYNLGKNFRGRAYDPNPHVLYLGAPVGRSGVDGASVDHVTIRQVWVSGNPRPVFPGDRQ